MMTTTHPDGSTTRRPVSPVAILDGLLASSTLTAEERAFLTWLRDAFRKEAK